MNKGFIKLGDKVMVSDPCYGLNTWCQGVIENVLPGNYLCKVEHSDEGSWGVRVAAIEVTHQDYEDAFCLDPEDFEVGVDSGQAGIFDYDYYAKYHTDIRDDDHVDDDWYARVCGKTCESIKNPDYESFDYPFTADDWLEKFHEYNQSKKCLSYIQRLTANAIDGLGFVSSSGYGDGSYTCYTTKNSDDKVVAIRVEFIGDEEDCEEDE